MTQKRSRFNRKLARACETTKRWYTSCIDYLNSWFDKPVHLKFGFVLTPLVQATFWLLTYLLAAFISIYSSELKGPAPNATEVAKPATEQLSNLDVIIQFIPNMPPLTGLVVLVAFLLSLFFAFSAWVKSKREDHILLTQQTSPPETFWEHFEKVVAIADEAYQTTIYKLVESKLTPAEIAPSIRSVLSALCQLVREWDTSNIERKVIYRANIMKVVYFDDDESFQIPSSNGNSDHSRFLHHPAKDHYSGLVYLDGNTLTASTSCKAHEPDLERQSIYFPFCLNEDESKSGMFISNLRGAPYTVVTCSPDVVSDTKNIIDHYKNNAEPVSKTIIGHLKQYYNRRNTPANSILSIPLFRPPEILVDGKAEQKSRRVEWVLNIYRDQSGMLYTTDVNLTFCKAVSGITARVAEILNLLDPVAADTSAKILEAEVTLEQPPVVTTNLLNEPNSVQLEKSTSDDIAGSYGSVTADSSKGEGR